MSRDLWDYAEVEFLWSRYLPETPFGRAAKEKSVPIADIAVLEKRYNRVEACLGLLRECENDQVRLDRTYHHLKRLPRFPATATERFDEVEIFQLKKFLFNHGRLLALLPAAFKAEFGLRSIEGDLESLLSQGRQGDESFHIADAYDPQLTEVRRVLRENERTARDLRLALDEKLRETLGFAFEGRDFVLLERGRLEGLAEMQALLDVEPWDAAKVCVRPRASAETLRLADQRRELLESERGLESLVLDRISESLRSAIPAFVEQARAVESFDLALAAARLAREEDLTRPVLGKETIRVEGARHLATESLCRSLGVPYTPLEAVFESGPTVLFGSNMGGKTVVLKTLGFLQLVAQTGLFVPATTFESRVFRHFHYVGEGRAAEEEKGLSGFGFEIRQFNRAHADFGDDTLALFDEFARTTSSREAEALLSAILEELVRCPRTVALFSTHFQGVRRLASVRYLRMGGLDRSSLDLSSSCGEDLSTRIREIDRRMRFCLEPDTAEKRSSDALAVARMLGLSPALASRAEFFHHDQE